MRSYELSWNNASYKSSSYHQTFSNSVQSTKIWFLALFCLYSMQVCVDWVLIIFGTQVIKEKPSVLPVFPEYLSVSYDYTIAIFFHTYKLHHQTWLLKWFEIWSLLVYVFSLIFCIQSHLICIHIRSIYMLFTFSQLACIKSHLIYSQPCYIHTVPSYLYSVSSCLYSVNLYIFSLILYMLILNLYVFSLILLWAAGTIQSTYILSVNLYIFRTDVLCVTLRI